MTSATASMILAGLDRVLRAEGCDRERLIHQLQARTTPALVLGQAKALKELRRFGGSAWGGHWVPSLRVATRARRSRMPASSWMRAVSASSAVMSSGVGGNVRQPIRTPVRAA